MCSFPFRLDSRLGQPAQIGLPAESAGCCRHAKTQASPAQKYTADTGLSISTDAGGGNGWERTHACDKLTWGGGGCRNRLRRVGCCERTSCSGRPVCSLFDHWSIHLHAALHCRLVALVLPVVQHGE